MADRPEHVLDLRWQNGMKWPRDAREAEDFEVVTRIILRDSNLCGLRHLQPLREFLERVANDGCRR